MIIDRQLQTLTAYGNVILELNDIKISSEEIIYYKNKNEIHAKGDVLIQDKNGNFHNGNDLILKNNTSNFYLTNIYAKLADGSQMTARNLASKNKIEVNCEENENISIARGIAEKMMNLMTFSKLAANLATS